MRIVVLLIVLSLVTGLAVPAFAQTTSQRTMLDNLASNSDFSTLANAAKAAGIGNVLSGSTPYTVFAPNNAAFSKIPKDTINALTADKPKLASLLGYHVVPGKISYADLAGMTSIKTVDGKTLPVLRQADGSIMVGDAKVLGQGIESSNGMIFPIDSVMVPPGFAMPQAAQSQGFPWGWLGLLGALALGALALYLLSRPKRREEPRARYEERARVEEKPRVEERARYEETRRPEETMREVRESTAAYREPQIADIAKNLSLPLSGSALAGLTALLNKGTFKDKQDFVGFLAKTYMQNDVGAAMAGGKEPSTSRIMDIIDKTGIARGFSESDTKSMLVPLFIAGFTAIYNYLSKRPAVKAT